MAGERQRHTRPHPKEAEIRALLREGYRDAEIRRRTGADVRTIARRRAEGGFGPATIRRRAPRKHPKDAEIRARLAAMSSEAIARELGVDRAAVRRIRRESGIRFVPPTYATAEEKWADRVRPAGEGHLEWAGERSMRSGSPVMRFREKSVSPAAISFRKRTGRDPVGQVKAECGYPHCIAPAHVEDEPGRRRLREQFRFLTGGTTPAPVCRHGHDQVVHGRFQPDGAPYCAECKREQRPVASSAGHDHPQSVA
ncbi:hypothetical protein AB0O20_01985 [Streptomyces kronopolitis]|uniref:hypothetical protein n=1 Tax=Streptomyces kronopolitis TaxID=1612435 RepID=UPI003420A64E